MFCRFIFILQKVKVSHTFGIFLSTNLKGRLLNFNICLFPQHKTPGDPLLMNKMCSRPIGETCRFGQSAFTSRRSVGRSVGWWVPLDTCPLKPSGALRAHKIRTKSTTSARGQVNARPKVRNHLESSLHRK